MKRLLISLLSPILGKAGFYGFFSALHMISLKGMNLGRSGDPKESGEIFIIKWISERYKNSKQVIVFDVGANIGDYSLLFINHFKNPNFKIFAFEPATSSFTQMSQKVKGKDQIQPIQYGISDSSGKTTLFFDKSSSGFASLFQRDLTHIGVDFNQKEEISLIDIDSYCSMNQIESIDFLKLDVEGNEFRALQGAKTMLASGKIDVIQFEFGGCNIDSRTYFKDFYNLLVVQNNYTLYRILQNGIIPFKFYNEVHEIFVNTNILAVKNEY